MREQLIQYIDLLFAGAADSDEIKQEILQNTLDRFDDLVAQGKSPEAAYRLAITGIGDINEILGDAPHTSAASAPTPDAARVIQPETEEDIRRKKIRAGAIALYIVCALPLIVLSQFGLDILGLCLTLLIVAFATYLIIVTGKMDDDEEQVQEKNESTPQKELKNSIGNLVWAIGLAVYLIFSFMTGAWYITWVIFPIIGCVNGIVKAVIDLKEASKHEN